MNVLKMFLLLVFLPTVLLASDLKGNWVLEKSEIDYKVTHPLHHVIGKSTQARGKGSCTSTQGKFIVAVPVKSFDSGDGNRDTHMLQITKGADNPLIAVNVAFSTAGDKPFPKEILADLEIQFAGKTVKYPKVKLGMVPLEAGRVQITAVVPLSLKAFDITPPSLLGVPIEDLVPVQLEMTWKKAATSEK
ncbi:MAG TPA: YceI family protein [bacterium]|jgi:hypothetical protein|nr:YceI family protein [bacterium]